VIGRFFAAIGGVKFSLIISARSFATTSDTEAFYFFLFLSGHEKVLIGLACFDKQSPPKSF
jgi:hypothetical protein